MRTSRYLGEALVCVKESWRREDVPPDTRGRHGISLMEELKRCEMDIGSCGVDFADHFNNQAVTEA